MLQLPRPSHVLLPPLIMVPDEHISGTLHVVVLSATSQRLGFAGSQFPVFPQVPLAAQGLVPVLGDIPLGMDVHVPGVVAHV